MDAALQRGLQVCTRGGGRFDLGETQRCLMPYVLSGCLQLDPERRRERDRVVA